MISIPAERKGDSVPKIAVNSVEAAKMLGISSTTLTLWTRAGKIPHRKMGRRLLYSVAALEKFLEGEEPAKQQ